VPKLAVLDGYAPFCKLHVHRKWTSTRFLVVPITMMRNALGVDEGGSGVRIDREAYAKSVAFWERHANWRG
jgi:hypothetical protein